MQNTRKPLAALALVALAIPAQILACGGSDKPANGPPPPSQSAWPPPSGMPSASSSAWGPTSASAAPNPFPTAPASASASAAPTSSATLPNVNDLAADAGLLVLATKSAPGMQADGSPLRADLQEAGHAEQLLTLQPGKCYTIIGFSPLGQIKDVDLHLLAPPFYVSSAGDDKTTDNAPIIGKAPSPICPLSPIPLAYKLDVNAKKGAGRVVVQLYSKAK